MSIVLMGIKHCGKSTQGRIISKKLSVPFFDTDDVILEMTGKTPRQIYTKFGNEGFQDVEEKACSFLLEKINSSAEKNAVIATGGGICGNKKALDVLRKIGTFVFLKTPERIASFRVLWEISVAQDGTLSNVPAFIKLSTHFLFTASPSTLSQKSVNPSNFPCPFLSFIILSIGCNPTFFILPNPKRICPI